MKGTIKIEIEASIVEATDIIPCIDWEKLNTVTGSQRIIEDLMRSNAMQELLHGAGKMIEEKVKKD